MANGSIRYNVGFDVDSSGLSNAKKGLQELQQSLQEIQHMSATLLTAPGSDATDRKEAEKKVAEARKVGREIEQILQKSYNPKLDTINITKFNEELKKSGMTAQSIRTAFSNIGPIGEKAFRQVTSQISRVKVEVKQTNKMLEEMKTTMVNTVRWGFTSSIWNNMTGAVEKAWGFAKKLDSSLNDIRIVTGKSAEDMEKFAVQANKAAKILGSSTTDYTNASLIYYQQGLNDAEVKARTETTLKAANITGQSTAEVSEQLTAVWNGYKASANEAELYVDKLSAVAATTASDLEELSTGMSKVASAASIMGVDIDQLNAQLATIVSVTRQAPESVGTALKTIYARMGDIEAGLDTETSLGSYTKEMKAMGFNVLDTNGKLKDMGAVIEEIGGKWKTLSREQQVALSQTMAGTRQYNNLLSLFDNWDMYTESLKTSKEAAGTLQEQQEVYMESTEAHLQRLTTESEHLYNALFDVNTINPFIDALTQLLSLLTNFVDGIGGIVPILGSVGAIGLRVFSSQIGEGLSTTIFNFKNASKNAETLRNQLEVLEDFSHSGDMAAEKQAEVGQTIVKMAQHGIISQDRADELTAYTDRIAALGDRISELSVQTAKYDAVNEAAFGKINEENGNREEGALDNITSRLKQANEKDSALGIDTKDAEEKTEKIVSLFERIKTERDKLIEQNSIDLRVATPEELQNLNHENEALKELNSILESQLALFDELENNTHTYTTNLDNAYDTIRKQYKGQTTEELSKTEYKGNKQNEVKTRAGSINKNIEGLKQEYQKYDKYLTEEEKKHIDELQKNYLDAYANINKQRKKRDPALTAQDEVDFTNAAQKFQDAYYEAINNIRDQIGSISEAAEQSASGVQEAAEAQREALEEGINQQQEEFADAISPEMLEQKIKLITDLAGSIGSVYSAISMVSDIVNVLNDDSLTTEEKVKQFITLAVAAIPMLLTGITGIKAGLIGLLPAGTSAALGLTATGTAAAASGAAATGAAGGFTALWAAMGPIGWIVLGLTAAVAGLTVVLSLADKAYNADAIAAEKAAEAYQRATDAATQANSAYTNLKDTLSEYDKGIKGLEDLTEGTTEYKEAIQEANQAVLDLIENGDILASQVYRDENGVLVISVEAREEAEKRAEQGKNVAVAAQNYAHAESVAAQQKANTTDFNRKQQSVLSRFKDIQNNRIVVSGSLEDQEDEAYASLLKVFQASSKEKGGVISFDEFTKTQEYTNLAKILKKQNKDTKKITDFYMALAADINSFVKESESASQESSLYIEEAMKSSLLNKESFAEKTSGQQSVIATQYAKKIDLSEDNAQYQKLNEQAQQAVSSLSEDELKKQFADYMGYRLESGKLYDSNNSEVTYSKEEAETSLTQKYIGENLKDYNEDYYNQLEKIVTRTSQKIEKAGFDEKTNDAILNLLTAKSSEDRNFNTTEIKYEDYEQLMSMTEKDLNKLIQGIDFEAFDIEAEDFVNRIQESIKNTDWSATFQGMVDSAKASVKLVNNALDKFEIGKKLDEDVINSLEQKFPELKRIWDKTSQEYYDALREAQEKSEEELSSGYDKQSKYEYGEIGTKQADYTKALTNFNEISSKSAEERFNEAYEEAYDKVADTAGEYIDAAEAAGFIGTFSDGSTYVNSAAYGETEEGKSSAEYNAYQDAKKHAAVLEEIKTAQKQGIELTKEQTEVLDEDYTTALNDAADAAKNLKTEVEDTFKADYELEISITNDLLTDVDEIVNKAENAKTAVEMIGEGFKVSAKNSEELLTIFPELAHNAQVLADGTIQLDKEVTKEVLGNNATEIDSDTEVAAAAIDNRIAELEADKAAMEAKLEDLHNTSVAEFDVQKFLGDNYQDFKEEEVNSNALAAKDEVANSALSAKAVITNWQAKIDAAKAYAAIAAAAEAPGHDVSDVPDNVQEYVDSTVSSVDTSNSVEETEEEKKKKEEELAKINQELYNLTEDYLTNKISSDEKQIAQLLASKSELYAGIKNIETAAMGDNVDLLKDEIDRYHDINIELNEIASAIERVSKAQEHLIGKDLLVAQEQEIKLLKNNIKLRKEKLKIQQNEAKELQGHLLADGVKFNEDGSIANYAKIMQQKINEANAAIQAANAANDKETANAAKKNYEEFKKNFERYEAVRDEIEDLTDEITDALYEQIEKKVAAFTAKINVKLDTAKAEKDWKEFTNKLLIPTNDALAQMNAQNDLLKSDRSIASRTTANYDKIVQQGLNAQAMVEGTAAEGTKSVYAIWDERLNEGKGGYRFDEAKWKEDIDSALQESQDAILQILDDIDSLGSSYIDLLEQTIDAQKEQLAIYDDMNSLLNHAVKLQELFTGENDYGAKASFYEEQQRIAREKTINADNRRTWAMDNIDSAKQDYLDAKTRYDEAVASGTGDTTTLEKYLDIAKQKYEDIKNELKDSTEDFYTSIEEQIEAAKNVYINTVNKAIADMDKQFIGNQGLSYISEEWDLINKNADRYLDTVNSTYEVQSLQMKYQKSINDTNSISAQKKLKKAMEEEIKLLQEKDKLSQYDIDRANKKYELTLKQIALEEAQANKSTMRLRRDAQGNYSYQFVADEDAVNDAQQELLALQNELYNFDKERYQQTLDDALAVYQEYQQKMLEAAQITDPEERAAREQLITQQYQDYIASIAQDNSTVSQNLQQSAFDSLRGQYDVNAQNFEEMTKGMFEDFSQLTVTDMPSCMTTLVTGWDGSLQQMVDKLGNEETGFSGAAKNALDIITAAGVELDDELITLGEHFSDEDGIAAGILNDVKDINEEVSTFKTEVLDPTVEKGQTELPDAWKEYRDGVDKASVALKTLTDRLGTTYTKANSLYKKLQEIASQSPINVKINYETTGDPTTPSGNYTGGGGTGELSTGSSSDAEEEESNVLLWRNSPSPSSSVGYDGYVAKEYTTQMLLEAANLEKDYNAIKSSASQADFMRARFPTWRIINRQQTKSWGNTILTIQEEKTGVIGYIPETRVKKYGSSGMKSFDTGGYTGEWGNEGRMAMLHEKEIVLNKEDTANILDAVSIVRNLSSLISIMSSCMTGSLSSYSTLPNIGNRTVDQNVHIEATFPNVTDSSEIEDALNNLVNIASQRAFNTSR